MTEPKGTNAPTGREKAYLALCALVLALIAALVLLYPRTRPDAAEASADSTAAEAVSEPRAAVQWIEVEKKITAEELEGRLRDVGVLITGEYCFTDLVSFSSVKTFLKTDFALPFTETSYMVRYDGTVSAGVDLADVRVDKDDARGQITVHIPRATIRATTIDLDSFTLLGEKTGLGNPLSVRDVNDSLRAFEASAREKAVERGLTEQADRNAQLMIGQFIGGLVGSEAYAVRFETIEQDG